MSASRNTIQLTFLLGVIVGAPLLAHAQRMPRALQAGDLIRIQTTTHMEIEGLLVRADSGRLRIKPVDEPQANIALYDVTSVKRSSGTHTIGRKASVAGILGGVALGVIVGDRTRTRDLNRGGLLILDFPYRTLGAILGGTVGAVVGGVVAHIERRDWEAVDISGFR